MLKLHVWLTKDDVLPDRLEASTAVVIDVFLATTTLITALENGARSVYAAGDLDEVQILLEQLAHHQPLTAGEEDGIKIATFDLGPYPHEFSPEVVRDRDLIFLTTNGTRAMRRATAARQLLLLSLRNAHAVADYLARNLATSRIDLICAGSQRRRFALEDFLAAGLLISLLQERGIRMEFNDAAHVAYEFYSHRGGDFDLVEELKKASVGKHLAAQGEDFVIDFVADTGTSSAVVAVEAQRARIIEAAPDR